MAAVNGQEAYLLAEPVPADRNGPPPPGPSRLLHTTDGSQSWQDVPTDLPTSEVIRPFSIAADGSLMVVNHQAFTSTLLVSRDGGRHFTAARQHSGDGGFDAGPGGAWLYDRVEQSAIGADLVQFTTDGLTWTRFLHPA